MNSLILVLSVAGAAAAQAEPGPEATSEDEYSERAILKKQGIPMPPSQKRKAYLAWKKRLPKKVQRKIDRHCRAYGGTYMEVCNGIGPYAIPRPPSRIPTKRTDGNVLAATSEQWQAGLSPIQKRYYAEYCDGDEDRAFSDLCGGTPIVLAFSNERVAYTEGRSLDWPTATSPWLARDVDGDGAISGGAELFGSDTQLPDGNLARHGFQALAVLDANRDGQLDGADPAFASLVIWADRDGDRQSSPAELTKLAEVVVAISLAYRREAYCDARGNCEGERSTIKWRDASGVVQEGSAIDVYLRGR